LVLFTDGEDLEGQVDKAVRRAKEAGVVIYTVGIGTPQGKPIPIRDAKGDVIEYRKDPDGKVVVSSLDERALAEIAAQTGGRYFRATTSENEIDALAGDIAGLEKKELESRLFQNLEDRFQYPLALALFCLIAESWISERRKPGFDSRQKGLLHRATAVLLFLLLILTAPPSLRAESAASKNKRGNRLFAQGKYEDAEKAYLSAQGDDPGKPEILYNLGNSLVKQQKYREGVQALQQSIHKGDKGTKERGWYNTGTALFSAGNYRASADAFVEALKLDPADRDAKHNLELALMKLKEQEQKENQPESGKDPRQQKPNQDKNSSGDQREPNQPPRQPEDRSAHQGESMTQERALQLLDAMQNQETAEQRRLLERRAREKVDGRDW
jgi:Ca-activated chloride channel family protein